MIQTKEIDGQDWIQPSDLFEWTIETLKDGKLNGYTEDRILNNLKGVEWIKEKIQALNGLELANMYNLVLESIIENSMPPDPMSLSAMYYNFTHKGLNTEKMRNAINSSPLLLEEIKKMIRRELK